MESRAFIPCRFCLQEEIWTKSRYQVFQKVTDNANAAMQHFFSPQKAELAIKSFLVSSDSAAIFRLFWVFVMDHSQPMRFFERNQFFVLTVSENYVYA